MPTYNFKCNTCLTIFPHQCKISERNRKFPCPNLKCVGMCSKIYTKPTGGFILKGPGWHKSGGFLGKNEPDAVSDEVIKSDGFILES